MVPFPILLSALLVFPPSIPHTCTGVPDDMGCVPGGTFIRGSRRRRDQQPVERIHVSTFFMDKYEVTAQEYDDCVRRGRCIYQKTNYPRFSDPDQPKVGISWFAARHYCRVHGKRLPTEAEWEKAARGPNGEQWPWGSAPVSCAHAIIKSDKGRGCGRVGFKPGKGRTWNVGSRPMGRYGLYDLIGNADEYVNDWYSESYALCGRACRGPDPKGPCQGRDRCHGYKERGVRGGSWYWGTGHAYGSFRRGHFPSQNRIYHHFGFRCARDPDSLVNNLLDLLNLLYVPLVRNVVVLGTLLL